MVAAACSDMEAERGDLVGDSLRGTELSLSGGDAMMIVEVVGMISKIVGISTVITTCLFWINLLVEIKRREIV